MLIILCIDTYWYSNYNIIIDIIKFEWDENKNLINQKKHKISFEEAQTVFYDTEALVIDDPDARKATSTEAEQYYAF